MLIPRTAYVHSCITEFVLVTATSAHIMSLFPIHFPPVFRMSLVAPSAHASNKRPPHFAIAPPNGTTQATINARRKFFSVSDKLYHFPRMKFLYQPSSRIIYSWTDDITGTTPIPISKALVAISPYFQPLTRSIKPSLLLMSKLIMPTPSNGFPIFHLDCSLNH